MRLKILELNGFKSFSKKTTLEFDNSIVCVVGPNGSGKSNVVEAIRYVLGEQSMKSMRGKTGSDLIFKGSKNLPKGSRATVSIYFDNYDKVFKLSNNEGETIDLNYDTISITRQVYPDGLNKYILNGTEVRLKDIHNLLKKQVEKFEQVKEMQTELATLYREYLKKESIYLEKEKKSLSFERNKISNELEKIASKIYGDGDGESLKGNKKIEELKIVEQKLNEIRGLKSEIERKLGRIEGILESKETKVRLSGKCPLCGNEIKEMGREHIEKKQNDEKELTELKNTQAGILAEIQKVEIEEKEGIRLSENLKKEINTEMETLRDLEREKFTHKVRHQELFSALELVVIKEVNLKGRNETFENEIREGIALIGEDTLSYKNYYIEGHIDTHLQEEQRKKIERLKIKLEDAGLGNGIEVTKEFKEVSERDGFLVKEMEDLTKSIDSLVKLITDLKEKIDLEFKEGVKKINVEFQEFFSLMFGGGHGSLSVVVENKRKKYKELDEEMDTEEEIAFETGIEINVSLPHKKVKELHALSGGERSLTSIALLFAMSQVNPPPFLVLDETDAALDEANSRKYGDMLEKLSKHSQLIVVTHNRETMSRAGVLYGVTIGSNGASKLLSVKFEEATQIAK